jgi:hypothetical protein
MVDLLKSIALIDFSLPELSDRMEGWYDELRGADTWYADVSTIDVAIILVDDQGIECPSPEKKDSGTKTCTWSLLTQRQPEASSHQDPMGSTRREDRRSRQRY